MIYYLKPFNQRRLKNFYKQFIKEGDLCFDIGAHLGNRSSAWLALGAKVIAVEPQPACLEFLNQKFKDHTKLVIIPKAVGQSPGFMDLKISYLNPSVSSFAGNEFQEVINEDALMKTSWDEEIQVEITTIDALISEFGLPKFCKIDVENFELEALLGLNHPLPAFSFEFFNSLPAKLDLCLDKIDEIGHYSYNWSIGESQQMESKDWLTREALIQQINEQQKAFSGDIYARLLE